MNSMEREGEEGRRKGRKREETGDVLGGWIMITQQHSSRHSTASFGVHWSDCSCVCICVCAALEGWVDCGGEEDVFESGFAGLCGISVRGWCRFGETRGAMCATELYAWLLSTTSVQRLGL